jgi:hypothetical protein
MTSDDLVRKAGTSESSKIYCQHSWNETELGYTNLSLNHKMPMHNGLSWDRPSMPRADCLYSSPPQEMFKKEDANKKSEELGQKAKGLQTVCLFYK